MILWVYLEKKDDDLYMELQFLTRVNENLDDALEIFNSILFKIYYFVLRVDYVVTPINSVIS